MDYTKLIIFSFLYKHIYTLDSDKFIVEFLITPRCHNGVDNSIALDTSMLNNSVDELSSSVII